MDNNNELFDLMTKMYSEMQKGFNSVNKRIDKIEDKVIKIENEVIKINSTIENETNRSITALLDGYKQNSEQITRIENKLNEHDEIIIKRVK